VQQLKRIHKATAVTPATHQYFRGREESFTDQTAAPTSLGLLLYHGYQLLASQQLPALHSSIIKAPSREVQQVPICS